MKLKTILLIATLILLAAGVSAEVTQIDEHNFEMQYGDELTLNMAEFSYVNVRTTETNEITVQLEDASILFTITDIGEDGGATLSSPSGAVTLPLGAVPHQFELQGSKFPVIFVENDIFHPSETTAARNVVLRFTVPLLNTFDPDGTGIGGDEEEETGTTENNGEEGEGLPEITGEVVTEPESKGKDPYLKYFIGAIILLLIIIVVLGPKGKKDTPAEEPAQEVKAEAAEEKKEPKKPAKKK